MNVQANIEREQQAIAMISNVIVSFADAIKEAAVSRDFDLLTDLRDYRNRFYMMTAEADKTPSAVKAVLSGLNMEAWSESSHPDAQAVLAAAEINIDLMSDEDVFLDSFVGEMTNCQKNDGRISAVADVTSDWSAAICRMIGHFANSVSKLSALNEFMDWVSVVNDRISDAVANEYIRLPDGISRDAAISRLRSVSMEAAGIKFSEDGTAHMVNAPDIAVAMLTPDRVFNAVPGHDMILSPQAHVTSDSTISAMVAE